MFSWRQLFRGWSVKAKTKPVKRPRRARLEVETLESRFAPAITAAFDGGVLTISMSIANDNIIFQAEKDGGIDVSLLGNAESGPPGGVTNDIAIVPIPIVPTKQGVQLFPDNYVFDLMGVTSIVVQNTSPGASALNQQVGFVGTNAFPQAITTNGIDLVSVSQPLLGTVSGNAGEVDVDGGTIQNGVDLAAPGGVVNVGSGLYTAATINKSLTLNGARAGTDARTRDASNIVTVGVITGGFSTRQPIVHPETELTGLTLEADNATVDGVAIVTRAGATNPGITTSPSFSGYHIRNTIFMCAGGGLSLGSDGASQTIVVQNVFEPFASTEATAVSANQVLANLLFQNNVLSGAQQALDLAGSATPLSGLTIANNVFKDGNSVTLANTNNSVISGNQFTGQLPTTNLFIGPTAFNDPAVVLDGTDATISVTGNSFINRGGLAINVPNTANVTGLAISANFVSQDISLLSPDLETMIDLSGVSGTTTATDNIVTLSGRSGTQLDINGLPVQPILDALDLQGPSTGVFNIFGNEFNDDSITVGKFNAAIRIWGTLPPSVVINIRNNRLSGFGYAIDADELAQGTQVRANFNDLSGNRLAPVVNQPIVYATPLSVALAQLFVVGELPPPPDVLDLQDNWWGVTSSMAIAKLGLGTSTPTAWLTSGLDTQPTVTGFQPDLSTVFNNAASHPAPTLELVPKQNLFRNQGPVTLPLFASEPQGDSDTVTYNAYLPARVAVELQQTLHLTIDAGGLYSNYFGQGEKWLRGITNQFGLPWYFISPAGQLFAWDGTRQLGSALVATLTPAYSTDPGLLAHPPAPPAVQVSVAGNQLTIDVGSFVGSFDVIVEATDGLASTYNVTSVSVTSRAPAITPIPDQIMTSGETELTLPIAITNPDNVPLNYSAVAGNLGYIVQQQYHLRFGGSYFMNFFGAQEVWLKGDVRPQNPNGNGWYFIKPTGELFAWDGQQSATGTSLATLDPIFYADPTLITSAKPLDKAALFNNALNLSTSGNLYENWGGAQEKWLTGNVNVFGNAWYFIKPDGELFAWDGTSHSAGGRLLATLDLIDYSQIQRLYAPVANPFTVSLSPTALTVNRTSDYLGSFDILLLVSDGSTTAMDRLHVSAD